MAPPRLVIIGAGGHARVAADIATLSNEFAIAGFIDEVNPERHGSAFCGSTILGGNEQLQRLKSDGVGHAFVAIGQSQGRLRWAQTVLDNGFELAVLRHPTAICAADAVIGPGSMLAAGAIVNPAVKIAGSVIVNTAASVDHECVIEEGVHIGPGARLGGCVSVGRRAWIGIGAVVKDRIRIGGESIVGAGAVVVKDIPDAVIAYGNPARVARPISRDEAALF